MNFLTNNKCKDIFVFYRGTGEPRLIESFIASAECLAHFFRANLTIIIEAHLNDSFSVSTSGFTGLTDKANICIVNDYRHVLNELLSGNHNYSSIAFCRDLTFFTKKMALTYDAIVIDQPFSFENSTVNYSSVENLGVDVRQLVASRYSTEYSGHIRHLDNPNRKCSFITSIFNSDMFLSGFLKNSSSLLDYSSIAHFLIISKSSDREKLLLTTHFLNNTNVIIIWNRVDPGLYECWNLGIRLSQTDYISNANVDDLRDPAHVSSLIESLEEDASRKFAACALYPFHEYSEDIEKHRVGIPWYSDEQGDIDFFSLGRVSEGQEGLARLEPHNLSHCMPIWRRSLHDAYGYFDEVTYGTYADWAFWLKVTLHGEKGYLNGKGLGFYYVNLESHNRRGDQLALFHRRIETEFLPHFMMRDHALSPNDRAGTDHYVPTTMLSPDNERTGLIHLTPEKKLDIFGVDLCYGQHRNDFNKLINALLPLHCGEGGVLFIPFIERYFVWGDQPGEAGSSSPSPITRPWVGIVHVPFDAPQWFSPQIYPENIFATELWKRSLPYCKGLIALSEDLRRDLSIIYPEIPNLTLYFPTDFNNLKTFDFDKFMRTPTIVQVGDWLRKLQAIYRIDLPGYKKLMLKKMHTDTYLNAEITVFGDYRNDTVDVLSMISNEDYDDLLSRSVVLCQMYATAANNLVLECIARKTPVLINSLPSAIEYLGEEYPLYADDFCMAKAKLLNHDTVKQAYLHLLHNQSNFENKYSYTRFYEDFYKSSFYENL